MLGRLGLTNRAVDRRQQIYDGSGFTRSRESVNESEDLERIRVLARRPRPTDADQEVMAAVMTALLTRGPVESCRCAELRPGEKTPCITKLLPIQGWYLYEAAQALGAIGHIIAGGGKTGIDILLAMVVPGCRRAVLMIPPSLRGQFVTDYQIWRQHFRVPNLAGGPPPHVPGVPTLDVIAYSELSAPSWAMWLKTSGADTLIGDEGQNLKDKGSTRTDRFLRFYIDTETEIAAEVAAGKPDRPVPYFFTHSGTLTESTCDEYGHLSALALRERSPVPLDTQTLGEWCEALDPGPGGSPPRRAMGALSKLCNTGETVRSGFRRRLIETLGVITSDEAALPSKLRLHERKIEVPEIIRNSIRWVKDKKQRPDGEILKELTEVAAACRQLAAGFFYIWRYPRGESRELIDMWFAKRQDWNRELRDRLEHRTDLLDSPGLLEDAAKRFYAPLPHPLPASGPALPEWQAETWPAWDKIEEQVQPVKDVVWLDDFLTRDVAAFMAVGPGVVWYLHRAFGAKIAELTGAPLYSNGSAEPLNLNPTPAMLERRKAFIAVDAWEGGDVADNWLKCEDGTRSIIASIKAHGTGKHMVAWSRALVTNSPVKGWEQLLARHHRQGQSAPFVDVYLYRHTPDVRDALEMAQANSTFVRETTGKSERLLYAEYSF